MENRNGMVRCFHNDYKEYSDYLEGSKGEHIMFAGRLFYFIV